MKRFDSIAGIYEKFRIEYPQEFIDFIADTFDVYGDGNYCDLGCGTGKFTKRLATLSENITGVDPSEHMLAVAKSNVPSLHAVVSSAEGFSSATKYDAVFVSHSFHWMDAATTLEKIASSLEDAGWVGIFWNNCMDREKDYYREIQALVSEYHDKPISERRGLQTGEQLVASGLFDEIAHREFSFHIEYTIDEYLGLLESKSYISDDIPEENKEEFFLKAKNILQNHFPDGKIEEGYVTDLYFGRKLGQ